MSLRRFMLFGLLLLLTACSGKQEEGGKTTQQKTAAAAPRQAPAAQETTAAQAPARSGKELFNYWCLPCHDSGPGHAGTQELGRQWGEDKAVLLQRHDITAEHVKNVVRTGFQMMPPFRYSEITEQQLDRIAAYVSSGGKKN